MSLQLDLPPELETELIFEAAQVGLPLSDYILRLLAGERAISPTPRTAADRLAYWRERGGAAKPSSTETRVRPNLARK